MSEERADETLRLSRCCLFLECVASMRLPHRCAIERLGDRCLLTTMWGLEAIDAPQVWERGFTGKDVVVAVIDSGVAVHSDLWSNVWVNNDEVPGNGYDDDRNGYIDDALGWDFADGDSQPIDGHRHGTLVAGTIAALRNDFGITGVAYEATVMPIRVFRESGEASTNAVAEAIRYATDNGADVINLSVGGISTRRLELAAQYAATHDVLIVAASGNEDQAEPVFPARYSATMENVISVGAHDQSFHRATTSNRVGTSGAIQVDAPGVGILSTATNNAYRATSGTSIAAAHVAGIAALALSAAPELTAAELRDVILRGATDSVADSDSFGAVDAAKTIALLQDDRQASTADADFDRSGEVDFADFLVLTKYFGQTRTTQSTGDADGDGATTFADFVRLFHSYGETSTPARRPRLASQVIAATEVVFEQEDTSSCQQDLGLMAFLASSLAKGADSECGGS